MNAIEQRNRVFRLVRLELANQMQFDPRMGRAQGGPLFGGFLHPVFAEHALPGGNEGRDPLGRMGLADGHQRDLLHLAPGNPGGAGDTVGNVGQERGWIGSWIGHGAVL